MWLSFSIFLMNINEWWFKLFTNSFLKKILDAERITLWASNFRPSTLARVTSQNSLSLIFFEHNKGTSKIGLSLDLSVIIVSYPLYVNCINHVLYPFCGFSCNYAVRSDLDCIVANVTLVKYLLILPGLVFLYNFYAN